MWRQLGYHHSIILPLLSPQILAFSLVMNCGDTLSIYLTRKYYPHQMQFLFIFSFICNLAFVKYSWEWHSALR